LKIILFYRNTKKSVVFDARETAPANATEDMFKDVPSDLGQLL
jgi:gamma-glutamyltranspeptidase